LDQTLQKKPLYLEAFVALHDFLLAAAQKSIYIIRMNFKQSLNRRRHLLPLPGKPCA
jgi:hypothetical protein